MRRAIRGWLVGALSAGCLTGCGSGPASLRLPAWSGGDRVELPWQPDAETLAERASAERARGELASAERFARWALRLSPEHPGGLVEAARVAVARARATPAVAAAELETARQLYALLEEVLVARGASLSRAGLVGEHQRVLLALAEVELAAGRLDRASTLVLSLKAGETPRAARLAVHEGLADAWIGRGAVVSGAMHLEEAARLGASRRATSARRAAVALQRSAEPRGEVEAALGRDAAAWGRLAELAVRRVPAQARWVAARAAELDPSPVNLARVVAVEGANEPEAWLSAARSAVGRGGAEAVAVALACVQGPRPPGLDAVVFALEVAAQRPPSGESLALLLAALRVTPTPQQTAKLATVFGEAALGWRALEAAPERWYEVAMVALPHDRGVVQRAAEIGRRVSATAALVELEEALRAGAQGIDLTLVSARGEGAGLRLNDADPRTRPLVFLELLSARGEAALASVEALGPLAPTLRTAWRLRGLGRVREGAAALAELPGFEGALARAHWQTPSRSSATAGTGGPAALAAWEEAVSLAPEDAEAAILGLAIESLWPAARAGRVAMEGFAALVKRWVEARAGQEAGAAERGLLEVMAAHRVMPFGARWAVVRRLAADGAALSVAASSALEALATARDPELRDEDLEPAAALRMDRLHGAGAARLEEEVFKAGRWELAQRLLSRLAAEEIRPETLVRLVRPLYDSGEVERARRYARAALAARSEQTRRTDVEVLATNLTELGEWALAWEAWRSLFARGALDAKGIELASRVALRVGDVDGWREIWATFGPRPAQAASALSEGYLELGLELAGGDRIEALRQGKRFDEMEAAVRERVEARDGASRRWLDMLVEVGRPAAALAIADEALARDPRDQALALAAVNAAAALRSTAVVERAGRVVLASAELERWGRLAEGLAESGMWDEALALVEQGLKAVDTPELRALRTRLLAAQGQGKRALSVVSEALGHNPSDALLEAPWPEKDWDHERRVAATARAFALHPERHRVLSGHVRALLAAGRSDEAERLLVGQEPEALGLGLVQSMGDYGHYRRALDLWMRAPDSVEAGRWVDWAVAAGETGRVELLERVALSGRDANFLDLAQLSARLGRPEDASRWLARADAETPSPKAASSRFVHQVAQGAPDEELLAQGQRVVALAVASSPGSAAKELDGLCETLLGAARVTLAAALVERVEPYFVRDGSHPLIAARVLVRAGRLGDALEALGRLPARGLSRQVVPHVVRLLEDLLAAGHTEAALGVAERLDLEPKLEILEVRARVAARAGYPERARVIARSPAGLSQRLAALLLTSERMSVSGAGFAKAALERGETGGGRVHAAEVLARQQGVAAAVAASPSLRADRGERERVAGLLGFALAHGPKVGGAGLEEAARALASGLERWDGLRSSPSQALWAAGLLDADGGERVAKLVERLVANGSVKPYEKAATVLTAGGLDGPAWAMWEYVNKNAPGRLVVALSAGRAALAAGRPEEVERVAERSLSRASGAELAKLELAAIAAAHGEARLGLALAGEVEARTPGTRERVARVELLSGVADEAAWDDAARRYVEAAPQEVPARLEVARQVLTTMAPDARQAGRAARVLAPLLSAGEAPKEGLELAMVAALWGEDVDGARRAWAEHSRRFPGVLVQERLVFAAALRAGVLVEEVLARVQKGAVAEVLRGVRGDLPAPSVAALDVALSEAPVRVFGEDASALEAPVLWMWARGDVAGALRATSAAWGVAHGSGRVAGLHAEALARSGRPGEAASVLEGSTWQRPKLTDPLGLLNPPTVASDWYGDVARYHLVQGELGPARAAWRRMRVDLAMSILMSWAADERERRPEFLPEGTLQWFGQVLGLGWALVEAGALSGSERRGFLASCMASGRAPWAAMCREAHVGR